MENNRQIQPTQRFLPSLISSTESEDLVGIYKTSKEISKISLEERKKLISIEKQPRDISQKIIMWGIKSAAQVLGFSINAQVLFIIADALIEQKPGFKIEDIILSLHYGTLGAYGPNYNKLDLPVIMGWVNQYEKILEEKIDHAYRKNKQDIDGVYLMADNRVAPDASRGQWRIAENGKVTGEIGNLKKINEFWKNVEKDLPKNLRVHK